MAGVIAPQPASPSFRRPLRWAGYAAAAWALVFALRGAYWALGGTAGLGALSTGIRELAAEGDPLIFAVLWLTVALEVFAAGLALALARPGLRAPGWLPGLRGRRPPDWALLGLGGGAGTLLAGHGATFVAGGLLATAEVGAASTEVRWYLFLWGPWFLLGGILFLLAARAYLRRSLDRRARAGSLVGAAGGLATAAAPVALAALAALA